MGIFIKKKGFTLIELLVVIAIIGILAGIVLAYMGGARSKARDAKRQSEIQQVLTAQTLYYSDHESYMATGTTEGIPAIGTYLGSIDDPQTTRHYTWLDNTSCDQAFCAYTELETGEYFAVSEKGTTLLDAAPTDGCACWTSPADGGEGGGETQTCSEKGGTCCSVGSTCSAGKISGASDCVECCGSVDNCIIGGGGGGEEDKANGETCSLGSECLSTFCVDGYCCNSACSGSTCQTCGQYSSGGAGTCGYVNSGSQDPRSDCSATGCSTGNCTGSSYACSSAVSPDTSVSIGGDMVYCDEHDRLWTATRPSLYGWADSVTQCSNLTYAGISDWVLPSCESHVKDSNCILYQFGIDACSSYPCSPTGWDAGARSDYYWSSTEYLSIYAWSVYFSTGYVNVNDKSYSHYIRCVHM